MIASDANYYCDKAKASALKPWFPPHLQRDIYLSLLHLEVPASGSKEKKAPAVPETVLKAALLRRAAEDINRLLGLRSQKPALAALLQKGSVGDDLWQRFLRAEKEMEDEVRDVVSEVRICCVALCWNEILTINHSQANAFAPNWGQTIFQSANEMAVNATFRKRLEEHQASVQEEKEWWDKKKATIQQDFMKELNDGETDPIQDTKKTSPTNTSAVSSPPAENKPAGSDEDAVLVEGGGPAASGGGAGGGGKKKKKGKK